MFTTIKIELRKLYGYTFNVIDLVTSIWNKHNNSTMNETKSVDKSAEKKSLHIIVLVLGDLGRSPRMQYHANSLLKQGHFVSFVGYDGEVSIQASNY